MRRAFIIGLGGGFLAVAAYSAELPDGDRAAGRKVAGQCRTCHGLEGLAKIPIAPNIGGEPASYIASQLLAFRDGRREHEMMSVVAKGLSDQAISDVAAWYAGHVPTAVPGSHSGAPPELCISCHGADGIAVAENAPNLAGETNIYIDTQLKAFRSGKRVHEIMSEIAAPLTDEEIRSFADWYAGIGLRMQQVD
jgi:cytochrome c553